MKVAFVSRYGPPEVVELRELADPAPAAGQVRIRVLATAVSAGDWRLRSGSLPRGFGPLRGLAIGFGGPRKGVLGTDACGVVDAIGAGVTRFAVGDPVLAFPGSAMGSHAEFLLMPEHGRVERKPSNLSFEEACALPFGGMTALDFLRRGGNVRGARVLVNGASGNVGSAFVQLARHAGAEVTGVCSSKNAALVSSLGATGVVDYARADFAQDTDAYDVIVDCVGNAPYPRVRNALAKGGRLLVVLGDLAALFSAPFVGRARDHRIIAGPAAERPSDLTALCELAEAGHFRPVIDRVMPFEAIRDAYALVDSGRKRGAVILSLDPRSASKG
jgi:NADPH:quinone reductase-like Zn-dependent oxidoreductase